MIRFKGRILTKLLMVLLFVLSSAVLLTAVYAMIRLDRDGFYDRSKQQFHAECREYVSDNYSLYALSCYEVGHEPVLVTGSSFRYAILKGMGLTAAQLKDRSLWLDTNITEILPDKLNALEVRRGDTAAYKQTGTFCDLPSRQLIAADPGVVFSRDYTVICFRSDKVPSKEYGTVADLYRETENMINLGMRLKYLVFFIIPISGLAAILCLSYLLAVCGHRNGEDKIVRTLPGWIPLDIFLLALGFMAIPARSILNRVSALEDLVIFTPTHMYTSLVFLAVIIFLLLIFLLDLVVSCKLGRWWENTVLYKLFHFIVDTLGRLMNGYRKDAENITFYNRIWVIFGLVTAAEGIGLVVTMLWNDYFPLLLLVWVCEKIIFGYFTAKIMSQFGRIRTGALRMSTGDVNYQIDSEGMFTDLRDYAEDLNHLSIGLSDALSDRMKSERFQTELITNVSHDIKTPLTSIITYVDILKRQGLDAPGAPEYLEVLSRQSDKLKKLIEDLIEASRASSGSLSLEMEILDASLILSQAAAEYQDRIDKKNLEFYMEIPDTEVPVYADSRHLWRVIDNLLSNILKYGQEDTRAYINLENDKDEVRFIFRNISREPLNISSDELMERFVRGDSSRNTEGSGLGMSIARSLTELMGGRMEVIIDGDLFK
ncbi:MAG: sensor histidine kinase, partial [Lachnospiraceae bacterium]